MENIKALLDVLSKVGVCETGKRYLNGTDKDINVLIKVWKGWAEYLYEHSDFACKVLRKYLTEEDKKTLECESLFLDKVGAFPRARPDPQGRPGNRLARGRHGRRHRRVRNAEH